MDSGEISHGDAGPPMDARWVSWAHSTCSPTSCCRTPKRRADKIFDQVPAVVNLDDQWAAGVSRLPNDAGLVFKVLGQNPNGPGQGARVLVHRPPNSDRSSSPPGIRVALTNKQTFPLLPTGWSKKKRACIGVSTWLPTGLSTVVNIRLEL